jgi:hypothetical protein
LEEAHHVTRNPVGDRATVRYVCETPYYEVCS